MLKKIFSDSVLYALGPQLPKIVTLILYPVITRYLTSDDYAISGIATAAVGAMAALRFLGLDTVMGTQFFLHSNHEKKWMHVWKQIFGFLLKWGFVYAILLALVLFFSLRGRTPGYTWKIVALLVTSGYLFDIIVTFGTRYFINCRKPFPIAIISTLSGVIALLILYTNVVWMGKHYMAFFYANFVASFFSAACYFYLFFVKRRVAPNFSLPRPVLKNYLRTGLPLLPHNYSSYLLNSSDRLLLNIYNQPTYQIGRYNFAYNISGYFDTGQDSVGLAVLPVLSKLYRLKTFDADAHARELIFFFQGAFLLLAGLIALWMKEIFNFLSSNSDLKSAYPYAIIILMGFVSRPLFWAANVKLIIHENNASIWKTSFVAGILNVVLNMIFIPYKGIYACMFTTFAAFIYMSFSGFFLKDFKRINKQNFKLVYWFAAIVGLSALVYLVKDYSFLFKIAMSVLLLVAGVAYLLYQRRVFSKLEPFMNA